MGARAPLVFYLGLLSCWKICYTFQAKYLDFYGRGKGGERKERDGGKVEKSCAGREAEKEIVLYNIMNVMNFVRQVGWSQCSSSYG